jgi:hypothetical protein
VGSRGCDVEFNRTEVFSSPYTNDAAVIGTKRDTSQMEALVVVCQDNDGPKVWVTWVR